MEIEEVVNRVVMWIDQAESQALQIEGSYANGGRAAHLDWMKNTLLSAPTPTIKRDLLDHWSGTGALPPDLLDW